MFKYVVILSVSAIALQGCGGPCRDIARSHWSKDDHRECIQCLGRNMALGEDVSFQNLKHAARRNVESYIKAAVGCGATEGEARWDARHL